MKKVLAIALAIALLLCGIPAYADDYTDRETVKSVQQALNDAGYDCGKPDGAAGNKTKNAILSYQQANGLEPTGEIDRALLIALGLLDMYEGEILFQGVAWGTAEQQVRDELVAAGFADPAARVGMSNNAPVWPEDDATLVEGLSTTPDSLFDSYAGYSGGVVPLKSIGGYMPEAVILTYLGSIQDGSFVENSSELVTAGVFYLPNDLDEAITIYGELLGKLEGQYGTFEKHANKSRLDSRYSDLTKLTGDAAAFDGFEYAFAVRYGQNNTAIMLDMTSYGAVILYYAKTDAYKQMNELTAIIEAHGANLEDAGL